MLYALGLGPLIGRLILLLTTTGRRSGLPRVTPLQYEKIDGSICVASIRGVRADWIQNILANPRVKVQLKSCQFEGTAQLITDPIRIAEFLELRLERHPRMIGRILKLEGLGAKPSRTELEAYASRLAMVIIRPEYDCTGGTL
jgi:deazaflavin-dependent oxidoreductase (nitroreductase family)